MNVTKIWAIVKNRYRLSTKIQMNFELSFPNYLIGKCGFSAQNAHEIRTQKVSPSIKGMVFSNTIPLSWFTSSVLIPWAQVVSIRLLDPASLADGAETSPFSSELNEPGLEFGYCMLKIKDPLKITIYLPWSEEFTAYVQKNKLIDF
ncbi:MAG: hypothetical protein HUN05_18065 [Desulfobacter sp.]|nr:MAG: hypothetical protein HUN05_18065 [Desulfobacter sp.]